MAMSPPSAISFLALLIIVYAVGTISLLARSSAPSTDPLSSLSSPQSRVGPTSSPKSPKQGQESPPSLGAADAHSPRIDHEERFEGYVTWCPCMGRLGNQLSQAMGVLALARALKRTLLLPPLVEYVRGQRKAKMVPWSTYFNVSAVNAYLPALQIEDFLASEDGARLWPPTERRAFCPQARAARGSGGGREGESCGTTDGNPFGTFWEHLNVTFAGGDVFYGTKGVSYSSPAESWRTSYPPSEYPVIAFTGAPASYPEREDHSPLQKYVVWTDEWLARGRDWREAQLPQGGGPVVGVHLRNGIDWSKACSHVAAGQKQYMASPQCLGHRNEHGVMTAELCLPSKDTVIRQVKSAVSQIGAKAVFVASDGDHMTEELRQSLPGDLSVVSVPKDDVHLNLVVLSQSDLAILNCVSSFSAIVARTRAAARAEAEGGWPTQYWAFSPSQKEGSNRISSK